MISLTLKDVWSHKRRLLSTVLAVTIGVSFLVGTLVLSDTTRSALDDVMQTLVGRTDVLVRPAKLGAGKGSRGLQSTKLLDLAVVDAVGAIDGVDRAEPFVQLPVRLLDRDGKPLSRLGPPSLGASWSDDGRFNPFTVAEGRAPAAPGEVVVNRGALNDANLRVGDRTTVLAPAPVEVTIVGATVFGGAASAAGAITVQFTPDDARRRLIGDPDKVTGVLATARAGVSPDELVARLREVVPDGFEAVTGAAFAEENARELDQQTIGGVQQFLLMFCNLALVVAMFSIYNTFSILAAQRSREAALLRAIGASRTQVFGAAVLETLTIGAVASVLGLLGGIAAAIGLMSAFAAVGLAIPMAGIRVQPATVATAVLVGVIVTFVAGVLPAMRYSRVPPLAALRDVAFERTHISRWRVLIGSCLALLGTGLLLTAPLPNQTSVVPVFLGTLPFLVGVLMLIPLTVRPVTRLLGRVLQPFWGSSARLARRNAGRAPRRTASTVAALMIAVGVVAFFAVAARSIKVNHEEKLGASFTGDLIAAADVGSIDGFPPTLTAQIAAAPEVESATGISPGPALLDGRQGTFIVTEPDVLGRLTSLGVQKGSLALGARQIAVQRWYAASRRWDVGSSVEVTLPDGQVETLTVGAIYERPELVGSLVIGTADYAPHNLQMKTSATFVKFRDGVDLAAGRGVVEGIVGAQSGVLVQDRAEYVAATGEGFDQVLALVYVMLALAVVVGLMGVGNTLSLAVHERSRELGLLRAVGQTSAQARSTVVCESLIIAVLGTVVGVVLGSFPGWAIVVAIDGELSAFHPSWWQLAGIVAAGGLAGVLAAARPARRVAKLDILVAINSD
jgi:putative ABC transport system permease protein